MHKETPTPCFADFSEAATGVHVTIEVAYGGFIVRHPTEIEGDVGFMIDPRIATTIEGALDIVRKYLESEMAARHEELELPKKKAAKR